MMPIKGDDKLLARLKRARGIGPAMDRWANESAEIIAKEARDLVDEGGIPSPNHIPSRPGQPPNTDSGRLAENTVAVDLPEQGHAAAISHALSDDGYSYSLGLEFGNTRVAERPFMRPATANKRKSILDNARKAVDGVVKGRG
jgi:hypothetical protein